MIKANHNLAREITSEILRIQLDANIDIDLVVLSNLLRTLGSSSKAPVVSPGEMNGNLNSIINSVLLEDHNDVSEEWRLELNLEKELSVSNVELKIILVKVLAEYFRDDNLNLEQFFSNSPEVNQYYGLSKLMRIYNQLFSEGGKISDSSNKDLKKEYDRFVEGRIFDGKLRLVRAVNKNLNSHGVESNMNAMIMLSGCLGVELGLVEITKYVGNDAKHHYKGNLKEFFRSQFKSSFSKV